MKYLLTQDEYDALVTLPKTAPSPDQGLIDLIGFQAETIDLLLWLVENPAPPKVKEPNWLCFTYRGVERLLSYPTIQTNNKTGNLKIIGKEVGNSRDHFFPEDARPTKSFFVKEMYGVLEVDPASTDATAIKRISNAYFGV